MTETIRKATKEDGLYLNDPELAKLLKDVHTFLLRFVHFSTFFESWAVALWVAHTYCYQNFDATPRLIATSAEPESGKTRLLEVLGLLSRSSVLFSNISVAALFRFIDMARPTILFDEVDTIFTESGDTNEQLRGILNAGYRSSGSVIRMVGGANGTPAPFNVFAPVAMGYKGEGLPDTILSRSIVINMKRKTVDEKVEPFLVRRAERDASPLVERLQAWADSFTPIEGQEYEPAIPALMKDRMQEVWAPLLTIADHAGPRQAAFARGAAFALSEAQAGQTVERSESLQLLADVRDIFTFRDVEFMPSATLLTELHSLEDAPWGEQMFNRPYLTAMKLGVLLKPYGIRSRHGREGNFYALGDFEDVFERYLIEDWD
jgi:Protein of unknown function (DUF3631)